MPCGRVAVAAWLCDWMAVCRWAAGRLCGLDGSAVVGLNGRVAVGLCGCVGGCGSGHSKTCCTRSIGLRHRGQKRPPPLSKPAAHEAQRHLWPHGSTMCVLSGCAGFKVVQEEISFNSHCLEVHLAILGNCRPLDVFVECREPRFT